MLAACRAAGASAWYVPDDYLTLGPELVGVPTASVAGTSGYFYTDFSPAIGKSYQITYQYSVTGGTSVQMSLGGSNVPSSAVGSGLVVYTITAANTNPLRCYSNAATAALSGISVKEVLSSKGFQDSVAALPTYLGGTVGMMFDAAGVTSSELIANPHTSANWVAEGTTLPTAVNGADSYLGKSCRSVTFPVIASGGYAVCRARDAENIFNVVTGMNYMASMEYALSRDLTAGESVSIAITGSSGIYAKNLSAGAPGGVWASASGGQPAVASGGGTGLRPYAVTLNAPLTVYVRAVSVKLTGGNVATQATAGNRPVVSRLPRKLGSEKALAANYVVASGGYDNTLSGVSASGFTAVAGTTQSRIALNFPTEIGKTYSATFRIVSGVASGSLVGYSRDSANGGGATINSVSNMNAGTYYSLQFVATSVASSLLWVSSVAAQGFALDNISVREVLEWSYALTFDGTNDSLAAPASIIGSNLSQPYTMIAWGKAGSNPTGRWMVGDSARLIGVSTNNKIAVGHAGTASYDSTYTIAGGESVIMEVTYDGGSAVNIAVNGTSVFSTAPGGSSRAPTTPAAATTIGQRGNATAYWSGDVGGAVVCPAVMTDAQRAAVRKFAAAQMRLII